MAFVGKSKQIVKWFVPYGIIGYRRSILQKKQDEKNSINRRNYLYKRNQIKRYFLDLDKSKQDEELVRIIEHFEDGFPVSVFPYSFPYKYDAGDIEVYHDKSCKMKYVLHNSKKMYFPKTWNDDAISGYYTGLLIEQDINSPHRYETPLFCVKDGDGIADIGAAEGIWALTYAEKAARIYLFECDEQWINALEKTFEPWKEKVVMINKYISNVTDENKITLDDFFHCLSAVGGEEINFIKADIEGAEIELLEGAKNVLSKQNNLKVLLCAYHRKNDEVRLKELLEEYGFQTEYSNGYMLCFYAPDLDEPYMRRGLIRAMKR
jgi:hypothetical protein